MYLVSAWLLLAYVLTSFAHEHENCQARDCQEVRAMGLTRSGVYYVTPVGTYTRFEVYCDMETLGGGWTVFQRREDGSVDFYRGWEDYQFGFGNVSGEHWLGNLPLYIIIKQGHYELLITLEDWEGETRFARYMTFKIGGPSTEYTLTCIGYSGDAGNSMRPHDRQAFTTKDRDNDLVPPGNCAELYRGAWWYSDCFQSELNGVYYTGGTNVSYGQGLNWYHWKGYHYSLKKTEMKIRRI